MSVIGTMAVTFSAGTNQSMNGYDNETGSQVIMLPQVAFPANSNSTAFSLSFTGVNCQQVYLCATANCTITTNNTNTADVQTITITGTPTGGQFPVYYNGAAFVANYNTNSATFQTSFQALSTVGNSNATVSGGPLPGTPLVITFAGSLNTGLKPNIVVGSAQLTGGTNSTATVTHTTNGAPTDTINLIAGIPRIWGASQGYGSNPFAGNVNGAFMTCNASTLLNVGIITT